MKRTIAVLILAAFATLTLESCFLRKNRCDTCPGIAKQKTVRKRNKGSV
jgi:hypothetical protein